MAIITRNWRSPVGTLLIGAHNGAICLCDWQHRRMRSAVDARIQRGLQAEYAEGPSAVIDQAIAELEAYFAGTRKHFQVPITFVGTDFQARVWRGLQGIPFGSTRNYVQLTALVAEPTAIRAVASANGANALSIMVPCHRVIGSDGALVGYAGGLPAKRRLLQLEGAMPQQAPDLFSGEHND